MDLLTLLYAFSVAFAGLTKGNNVLPAGPQNAAVGRNVMFTTTLDPTPTPLQTIIWSFEKAGVVVSSISGHITYSPGYEDRVTLFVSTGSLELKNVSVSDTGFYSVSIVTEGVGLAGSKMLNVEEPVSNVKITSSSTNLTEFSTARLSCSSFGSHLSFRWFNISSEVTASDRVHLSEDKANLTIVSISRYDQGPFMCNVSNLVSHAASDPITFNISYGPENVILKASPPQKYHAEGSDVTLSCSAVSEPEPEITWFFNGTLQTDTGKVFTLRNIQMHHSGSYSCQAFNSKTMKNETSQPLLISVLKKISDVSVHSLTALHIEGQSLNLTCNASGSVFTKEWMKDGSNLSSSDNIMFYNNNTMLSFKTLSQKDRGKYTCRVINPISSGHSTYDVVVNFGPENISIKLLGELYVNKPLKLRCSADSIPTANYTWTHNGTVIHHSSDYTKISSEFSDNGEYVCQATNDITEKTDSKMVTLEVKYAQAVWKWHTEEIVGIVFGCLAGFLLLIALVLGIRKKDYLREKFFKGTSSTTESECQDNGAYNGSQELNYAQVRFVQNRNGGKVELDQQTESSEYAMVRVNNKPPATSSPPTYDAHMEQAQRPAPQPDSNCPQYAQVRKK